MFKGYDIIGDIHGCARSLALLLEKMDYTKREGVYSHPSRQAIFIGDLIDRGPRIRETVNLVRDMVEKGHAQIVMGNHEYNYLCFCTPTRVSDGQGSGGGFLRENNQRNRRIVSATLEQYANYPEEQAELLKWILEMPLFLEFDTFRAIHACWHQGLIDNFKAKLPHNNGCLDEDYLHLSAQHGTDEWETVDRLLRGTHLRLPDDEVMISKDGFRRKFFRTKFWAVNPSRYADVVFQPDPLPEHIARMQLTAENYGDLLLYGAEQKPLFIGHYWRDGDPEALTDNIACIDYSAVKYGKLVAYRYDGEAVLKRERFVWVDVAKEFLAE